MLNIQPEKILYTGPEGCSYHAWNYEIKPNLVGSIDEHSDTLDITRKLDEHLLYRRDDVESLKQYIHVIVDLSRIHGFTHIVDEEMGILIDEPKPLIEVINMYLKGWPTGVQLRVLRGLDISHLG